jgi:hypothetical protein
MKNFFLSLAVLFLSTAIQAQTDPSPKLKWTISKQKKTKEYIEFTMKTKTPQGWMLGFKVDPTVFSFPIEVFLNKKDSASLVQPIELNCIKGERTKEKMFDDRIGANAEVIKGDIEYQVRVYLKNIDKMKHFTAYIGYWFLSEYIICSPQDQKVYLTF